MLQSDLKGVPLSHNALLPHHQFSTLTLGGGTTCGADDMHGKHAALASAGLLAMFCCLLVSIVKSTL